MDEQEYRCNKCNSLVVKETKPDLMETYPYYCKERDENMAAIVTRDEFQAYVDVQESGVTNMWAVWIVEDSSGLDEETILYIMKHYSELKELYS